MSAVEKEVQLLHKAYQDALVVIGGRVLEASLKELATSSALSSASLTGASARLAAIVYFWRKKARDLAVAHSQLERALLTGYTFPDDGNPFDGPPTLGSLRESFYGRLADLGVARPLRAVTHDPSIRVSQEPLVGLADVERRINALLDAEIDTTINVLGDEALKRKLAGESNVIDIGSRLASGLERIAINGARDHDDNVIRLDRRVVRYTRVHTHAGDNPCGWCSMLMTRGFLGGPQLYRSESAGAQDGHDGFHANCHCTVRKIYLPSQLQSDEFSLNREYAELWPNVTAGHSGKDALSAWRKFIRERYKQGQAALAAAA